jgi:hypothetical protein
VVEWRDASPTLSVPLANVFLDLIGFGRGLRNRQPFVRRFGSLVSPAAFRVFQVVKALMKRPQFRLSTLLWITLAVACWFEGMRFERWLEATEDLADAFACRYGVMTTYSPPDSPPPNKSNRIMQRL